MGPRLIIIQEGKNKYKFTTSQNNSWIKSSSIFTKFYEHAMVAFGV